MECVAHIVKDKNRTTGDYNSVIMREAVLRRHKGENLPGESEVRPKGWVGVSQGVKCVAEKAIGE